MTDQTIDQMSFEDALSELEDIVEKLESGQASLNESITLFERGGKLKAHCERQLSVAEAKVRQITLEGGQPSGSEEFGEG